MFLVNTLDGQMVLPQVRAPGTIGLLEGMESDDSKNLANVSMMTKFRDGMKDALAPNKRDLDDGMEGRSLGAWSPT